MKNVEHESCVLDDLDIRIIEALNIDGRMPVTDIAARVDSTPSTVRKRMQRMDELEVMRVVAITDYYAAGYDVLMAIGVEVENRSAEEVGLELAELDKVFSVNLTTGRFDLEILVAASNHEELSQIVHEELAAVRGISGLDTAFALDVFKYRSNLATTLRSIPK
ncbi:Lrp/AsnC family transcriptional regulator [Aestuariicella hydrocarbonica]|uniref:Lrp/AsnC family transcriptional regulator n=1 Tax=Pseudomaricurvus hydrocarbonicus TaxID=1470433 RepID=A0A9E5JV71_9GAMM|nr:Lrp/AsnC family transcriptional regulator [Aestuariicella hydrocarbonica]NHO66061.1 Lrp/AsnC family transcriptional regulator [Aestuariicella hydrocarbonica]